LPVDSIKKGGAKQRRQYGALPYRFGEPGGVEVLLVTSRETKRWVIPKGWPMKGRKPAAVAKREAFEEAGVLGEVGKRALGSYLYAKRVKPDLTVTCKVKVFPLEVRKDLEDWPERGEREERWFSPGEAADAVAEAELGAMIRKLQERVRPGKKAARRAKAARKTDAAVLTAR
jgi:8-oxo-dGTP pyrophosphatase MutT (NUDIX family)